MHTALRFTVAQRSPSRRVFAVMLLAGVLASCRDERSPVAPPAIAVQANAAASEHAGATLAWHATARDVMRARAVDVLPSRRPNPPSQTRTMAYLGLAEYTAVIAAEDSKEGGIHASPAGAVAGASAAVLSYFLPFDAVRFEAQVAAEALADPSPQEQHTSFAAGVAVGRAIGAQIIERARTDGFVNAAPVAIPVGPQYWRSSNVPPTPPLLPHLGQMRTFFIASGDAFRPGPPPVFGSPEYLAALAEVRHVSDTRTAEQTRIAQYWAPPALSATFDQMIADLVSKHHLDERRASHAFALSLMAGFDALIACHDAKYTYWLVRPTQADPGITLAPRVGLPNHPSYPSNHACIDGALDAVLSDLFPAESDDIRAAMEEGAISRLYGGLHYRFDAVTGLAMGRAIGNAALAADVHGHQQFVLR